jgi:hypothetical protein
MTAMETLLASSFEKTFSGFVDNDEIRQIKNSVFERYHMTLLSSIKDFKKFESTTEQILGSNGMPLIKKTFNQICHLESKPNHIVEIKDESLRNAILSSFEEPIKRNILDIAFDYPITIWEIAAKAKMQEKISENISYLISWGLLATCDSEDSEDNKKYYSTIDCFSVNIEDGQFHMYVTINDILNPEPLKLIY